MQPIECLSCLINDQPLANHDNYPFAYLPLSFSNPESFVSTWVNPHLYTSVSCVISKSRNVCLVIDLEVLGHFLCGLQEIDPFLHEQIYQDKHLDLFESCSLLS